MTAHRTVPADRSTTRLPLAAVAVSLATAALVVPPVQPAGAAALAPLTAERERTARPVIAVNAGRRHNRVKPALLGVNHHYTRHGHGVWNPKTDAPSPLLVRRSRRAGIQSLRYPGGTMGTMYEWKRSIGAQRGCQIEGHGHYRKTGFSAAPGVKAYGPDEFMEFADAAGLDPLMVVTYITGTPSEAADWVEYMNTPAGPGNPNGGVDWAERRAANGHRAPYGVRRWEVGNETHVLPQRYAMSRDNNVAVRQYANGGVRRIDGEALGMHCRHPLAGTPSDGSAGQVFRALFTPVTPGSFEVRINGHRWRRVGNLSRFGPRKRVYELRAKTGEVVFGDGTHGAVPREGSVVRASYRNRYKGFFAFAREMKEVDRSIEVCSSWGRDSFTVAAKGRRYDCLTAHPITNFTGKGAANGAARWSSPLEGHDRIMLGLSERRAQVQEIRRALPRRTPLLLTEFKSIHGDRKAFPGWAGSASHMAHMASLYAMWLKLGVGWGNGGNLTGPRPGPVLGGPPEHTYSAEAVLRETILPMLTARGRVVSAGVRGNLVRRTAFGGGRYGGLAVTATRSPGGRLWLMVVNRLPHQDVQAKVQLRGFAARSRADVRRVASSRFTDWNRPGRRASVRLVTGSRRVRRDRFTHTFPAHSVTVFRLHAR